jgi:hypothetical protein
MNQAPNFASILDEAPTEVKAPPLIPVGTYTARVGQYTHVANPPGDMKPYIEFPFMLIAPGDDVDEEALAEIGGISGKVIKRKYWVTEDAAVFFDQLHSDCGIDLSEPVSRRQRNDMIINAEVTVVVSHGQNKAGTRTFANIDRTLPAD